MSTFFIELKKTVRKNLIAGLLVTLPVALTIFILSFVINKVDDADCFELRAVKRNSGPLPPPLRLYYSRGALVPQLSLDMSEQKAEVSTVCAEVAILWAKKSLPIKKQAKVGKAVLDMIEERLGLRPSNADVKDILNRLVMDGRLKYMDGTGRRASGYYPPDQAEELARESLYQH